MIVEEKESDTREQEGMVTKEGVGVPLLGVRITGRLQGRAVELTVAQRYRNTGDNPVEAVYLFPLPEDAAACGLTVRTGDRVLRGEIEEREKAFERYDEAMSEGDGAVLLDQERPNVFQMSVGNLLPGQEAVVEMRMTYRAEQEGDGLRLLIPSTVSPRYAPASLTDEQRREFERTAPPYATAVPYGMQIEIDAAMASNIKTVESPSHTIRTEIDGRNAKVTLSRGEAAMDKDFVLSVETAEPHLPGAWVARLNGHDHILLDAFPEVPKNKERTARNVCFLVDCSGSMMDHSIDQARRAIELCLRSLREGDLFQIVRFGSDYEVMYRSPKKFTQKNLDEAVKRIRGMDADLGGTEIMRPLQAIAEKYRKDRVDVVCLTDGQVGNEEAVLGFAATQRGRVRIFSFGIGAGSSEFLVKGLARESGGKAEFIHDGERIEEKVLRQFGRIDSPGVDEILVDWAKMKVEQTPAVVPPLFTGDVLTLAARVKDGAEVPEGAVVSFSGSTAEGPVTWEAKVLRLAEGAAVPLFWARERIRDLEAGFGLPTGSRQVRGEDRQQQRVIEVSKAYGVMSSETSFVAVEERADGEKAEGPAELRKVPVAITQGWHGLEMAADYQGLEEPTMFQRAMNAPPPQSFGEPEFMLREESRELKFSVSQRSGAERVPLKDICDHTPRDETPWYLETLQQQNADGSFNMTDELLEEAGISKKAYERLAANWKHAREVRRVVATALVLGLLEEKAGDVEGVWRGGAEKAREWLENREDLDVERLMEEIRKLI